MKLQKFRTVAGIGLAALTLAACGSSQGAQVLTVPTTQAPLHHLDGLYVGNYKGNDAQAIVAAKKSADLLNTLEYEMFSTQNRATAIAETKSQLQLYMAAPLYKSEVAWLTTHANKGSTATLVKGTSPTNGTDNAPVLVTPDLHNPHELDVTTCGYNNIQETGVPGNLGDPGFWNLTYGVLKMNNHWVVVEVPSDNLVTACPAN